jgi:hypothetical protein
LGDWWRLSSVVSSVWLAELGVCVVDSVFDGSVCERGSAELAVEHGDLIAELLVVVGEFADALVCL